MFLVLLTGSVAGVTRGYVLQRGQLCFHVAVRTALERWYLLACGWTLGVALAAVGLSLLFLVPGTQGLNRGLAFRPVANIVGGLVIGAGMVVATACTSGLFYKLGSGMLGAGRSGRSGRLGAR